MKKPKLFTFSRFCWSIIIGGLIAQGLNWYYVPKEPIVLLDEWGKPVIEEPIPEKVWGTRDDTLSIPVDISSGGTSYVDGDDGDYSALKIDSSGGLWMSAVEDNTLRVTIANDDWGARWTRFPTDEQGYLQCENIDKERWALIPKEELDKFKAYKSQQLR